MIYDYVVTLKNQREKHVNIISSLLAIISAIFFAIVFTISRFSSFIFLVSFILILGGLAWNWYISIKKHKPAYYSRIMLVAGITWFAMPFLQWIGLPLILLAILERQARFPLEIGFTNERIVFNTLFKRRFQWADFNNILLKDGILTLDFKNNRVFQKETLDEEGDADEDEFNEYCRGRLRTESRE